MSDTRRDFLRLAAVGAGSLATLGVAAKSAQACCWWSSSRRSDKIVREPSITFPLPTNFSAIARNFTVYGTYDSFSGTPNIECKLWQVTMTGDIDRATGSVTFEPGSMSGTWMADFTVPNPPSGGTIGLKIVAKLLGTNATHEATNLTLFPEGGSQPPPPITITNPGNRITKAPLKKLAKPTGDINEPSITTVIVRYVYRGYDLAAPIVAEITGSGTNRKWKVPGNGHIDLTPHANKHLVSCHVEARAGSHKFVVSDHKNDIEP